MAKPKAILLGWVNHGRVAQCGETVKNQHIVNRLRQLGVDVTVLDFYRWRKRPWVLAKSLFALLLHPSTPLILSTAPKNVYGMMKTLKALRSRRPIIHWVIGGNLHQLVERGEISADVLNSLKVNIVETAQMKENLERSGVDNVMLMPNFKPIEYVPKRTPRQPGERVRFIFLSRIKPEKGVDYIFQAMRELNAQGYGERYGVDFYGRIDADYVERFDAEVAATPNASYRGFVDLTCHAGYDKLASYDAMLFPTYWKSEGFAGIFIDAFIAGLPVIATDWSHNASIVEDGKHGIIIPAHDPHSLERAMRDIIDGVVDLGTMRCNCAVRANDYNVDALITPQLLKQIGITR